MRNTLSKIMNWAAEALKLPAQNPWEARLNCILPENEALTDGHVGKSFYVCPQADGTININTVSLVISQGTLGSIARSHPPSIFLPALPREVKTCLVNATKEEAIAFLDEKFSDNSVAKPSHRREYESWKSKVTAPQAQAPSTPAPYL